MTQSWRALNPPSEGDPLTRREKQIVDLIIDGHSNINIGHLLQISLETVKTHISNILNKAGCDSRHQLAAKFMNALPSSGDLGTLKIKRLVISHQLAAVNEEINLLQGVRDEDEAPVIDFGFDFSARAGIASILADMVQGRE